MCGLEWQGHSNVIRVQALCINTHLGSIWADQERSLEQALEECQLDHMISPLFNSSIFGIVCKWSVWIYLQWTYLMHWQCPNHY